ncbi:MAG: hypothetical protein GY711_09050 [bacterium]|nr:hypothetical protein [bacterium]
MTRRSKTQTAESKPSGEFEALLSNVKTSVGTGREVMQHLRKSLDSAGFPAAIAPYRKMCDTLLGQRLWARDIEGDPLRAEFEELAREAQAVSEILAPYAELVQRLGAVAMVEAPTQPVPQLDPASEAVLAALGQAPRPMSRTRLREATGLAAAALKHALGQLADEGRIEEVRSGGRRLFRLSQEAVDADARDGRWNGE